MNYFDIVITEPLMWLVELCYKIIPNYVVAIILFTLIIKIVLFPFSLWAQVQAVKLAKMKPLLNDIKAYYGHDWRLIIKEQKKLYKKEKYSSFISFLPLLLQIPVIIGVIRGLDASGILSDQPTIQQIYIPLLAGLSAFLLCYVQNLCNVLAKEMGFFAKWGFAMFLVAFSFYFALVSGIGFGIYWTAGNLLAIVVQLVNNKLHDPRKYINYEILPPQKKDKELEKRKRETQKADVKRFLKTKKNLVFYSEASGFYKYFKGTIDYILENSKIHVHYLTSDIDDQVFKIDNPKFHAYYCGPGKLITVLMRLDCKMAVFTMNDLHKYQYKRSIVNKRIEYTYMCHGFGSLTYVCGQNSLAHFDTVFCCGKNHNEELRLMEEYYKTRVKNLVNTGYGLYHDLRQKYQSKKHIKKDKETIFIAPSWQRDNIFDYCIDAVMKALDNTKYKVVLRPHPEFVKKFPKKIESLKSRYKNELQLDFSTDILDADILITDWSTIGLEFAYAANKPTVYINTPPKIMNPDWDKYGVMPLELSLRDKIGVSVEIDQIGNICHKIDDLKKIENPRAILEEIMYDNSNADKVGAEYIIRRLKEWKKSNQ